MKCSDVINILEAAAHPTFAEAWDNVGLIVGRRDADIQRIYIAVDATTEVIEAAVSVGADMLLTHHPMIFSPMEQICGDDFIGRRVLTLAENKICYYAMHTNFDVMGMADAVADQLQLRDRQVLSVTYEDDISKEGIGRVGTLPWSMNLAECAELVKRVCRVDHVKVFGKPSDPAIIAAVCPGSGKSVIKDAIRSGADVLITGDIDHHSGLDAMEQGLSIIDAGHYGLEKVFVSCMEEYCRRKLSGLEVLTAPEQNPFWLI